MDKATDCLETKTAVRGTRLNPFANLKQSPHAAGNCFPGHATFHIHVQCLCMSPEGGDLQAWISDSVVPPHGKLFLTLIPGCIQTLLSLLTFLHLLRHELQSPRNQRIKKQRPEGCLGVAVSELLSSGRDVWNRNSEVVRPKKTEAQRGKRY
ncbi:PREDICTED: uncharacterized protein LOC108448259 isoform X5 [Corvus brachyrhynchos]|uniref:uncharacterized protein LOC108448259 isoform X5 n=1 Tax=Corvus brachyrhynchos TaxID=85066 RepID=UPI0008166F27|nr:PREDICTED: uncharacterized protein LOC108448259 isoform X5 [Corvus brachyrhynchos]